MVVRRVLQHAIGAKIEIVTGSDVGGMVYVGMRTPVLVGLHGARYHILLTEVWNVFLCQLTNVQQVVEK